MSDSRDPAEIAEEFVAEALQHADWEARESDEPALSYVERGTGNLCERFLSVPVPYLDACKIEALLDRGQPTAAVRRLLRCKLGRHKWGDLEQAHVKSGQRFQAWEIYCTDCGTPYGKTERPLAKV